MKYYFSFLTALFLCLATSNVKAQNIHIPDQLFKAYLIQYGVDANVDLEIQVSEAASFTGTIDISQTTITDLTGLEYFINLRGLSCINVPITSLDLSANVMLRDLRCASNLFTSLDLSQNVNLTKLVCNLQQVTSLDLSQNVNLVEIDCRGDSSLVSLNLKNGNNAAITNFMATLNPLLTCIEVDDSLYSVTNWPIIDNRAHYSNNCFYLSATNLEYKIPHLQAYPNPTPNALTVDLGAFHPSVNVNILNAIGQNIQSVHYINTQKFDLNLKGIPGCYFIHIQTPKRTETIKVLKQ